MAAIAEVLAILGNVNYARQGVDEPIGWWLPYFMPFGYLVIYAGLYWLDRIVRMPAGRGIGWHLFKFSEVVGYGDHPESLVWQAAVIVISILMTVASTACIAMACLHFFGSLHA